MPANLYGVANPVAIAQFVPTVASANISCSIGVETPVATSQPFIAVSPGWYYPIIWGNLFISSLSAPVTSFTIGARIGAGADYWSYGINWGFAVNDYRYYPIAIVGPPSSVPWTGAGSTVSVTINPAGGTMWCGVAGTLVGMALWRAPDQ